MKAKSYILKDNELIELTTWMKFKRNIKHFFTKWKLVNSDKYYILSYKDRTSNFILSKKEYEKAQEIYKEKGTLEYTFYPCGGIGWGVKVRVINTNEIIDITDVDSW